jgi:hypothetical protein
MAVLDGPAVEILQKLVREIAVRAERLQQLLYLGHQYRAFDTSYDVLAREVAGENKNFAVLRDRWNSSRDNDLADLQSLLENDCHAVRIPLVGDPQGGYGPVINTWSAQLKDLKEKVQGAIDQQAWGDVAKFCPKLQMTFKEHIVRHKNILSNEARRLSFISEKLLERLEA